MELFIFGAGRAGRSIARLFSSYPEIKLLGIYNRTPLSKEIKKYIDGIKLFTGKNYGEIDTATHIIFAISDDALKYVVKDLYNHGKIQKNQFWFHLSGSLPSDVLRIHKNIPNGVCSIHPFQTLSISPQKLKILKKTFFIIEGDKNGIKEGEKILKICNLKYLKIDKNKKPLYHAGAVMASNFFVLLSQYAEEILEKIGFSKKDIEKMLISIFEGTLQNIKTHSFHNALTGPIVRNDTKTIKNHLKVLKEHSSSAFNIYKAFIFDKFKNLINEK